MANENSPSVHFNFGNLELYASFVRDGLEGSLFLKGKEIFVGSSISEEEWVKKLCSKYFEKYSRKIVYEFDSSGEGTWFKYKQNIPPGN